MGDRLRPEYAVRQEFFPFVAVDVTGVCDGRTFSTGNLEWSLWIPKTHAARVGAASMQCKSDEAPMRSDCANARMIITSRRRVRGKNSVRGVPRPETFTAERIAAAGV